VVRAMPAVRAKFPGARLLLAGDGSCRKRLEALTKQFGLQDAIIFAGFVEDVAQVYAALDIFVFPSLAEPLGTSLLAATYYDLGDFAAAREQFGLAVNRKPDWMAVLILLGKCEQSLGGNRSRPGDVQTGPGTGHLPASRRTAGGVGGVAARELMFTHRAGMEWVLPAKTASNRFQSTGKEKPKHPASDPIRIEEFQ